MSGRVAGESGRPLPLCRSTRSSNSLIERPLVFGNVSGEIPGQQFFDAVDGVLCDAGQYVPQVTLRIDSVQLGCSDQTVNCCGAFSTAIRSREQVVLSSQSHDACGMCERSMPALVANKPGENPQIEAAAKAETYIASPGYLSCNG